jgi:hypothetical protein
MGASSSVQQQQQHMSFKDNYYISYDENDRCGDIIHDELILLGLNVLYGRSAMIKKYDGNVNEIESFTVLVNGIMNTSTYIIICISEKTVCSFYQAIEINSAIESNKKIIYIMTDENFTPLNKPYLNGLVKNSIWLPAYDNTTIDAALRVLVGGEISP